jgi:hypothetical protein
MGTSSGESRQGPLDHLFTWARATLSITASSGYFTELTSPLTKLTRTGETTVLPRGKLIPMLPTPSREERSLGPYLRWVIPNGLYSFDIRLFRMLREQYTQRPPLVIEVLGRGGPVHLERRQEFLWSVERGWVGAWADEPPRSRPDLLISEAEGGTVLLSDTKGRFREGMAALACNPLVSTETLAAAMEAEGIAPTASSDRSAFLKLLAEQRLLVPAKRHDVDRLRSTLPVREGRYSTVYVSLLAHVLAKRVAEHSPARGRGGDPLRLISDSYPTMYERWRTLVERLRKAGLRTV